MHEFDIGKIGSIRKKLGLTQTELAKLAGVSQSLIAKVESRRVDPAYSKAKKIFEALENEMDKKDESKRAAELMTRDIISLNPNDRLERAIEFMRNKNISQIPVFEGGLSIGSVSEDMIIDWITKYGKNIGAIKIKEVMNEGFPILPENAAMNSVAGLLRFYKAVLVKKGAKITGIITKADLIKAIR